MYIPLKIYALLWEHVKYVRYVRVCVCCCAEKTVCAPVCVWAGWGHHINCSVWVRRADGAVVGAATRQRGVTWVQWPPGAVTWTPSCTVVKSDCLIRGKQKCCQSVRPDKTSTTAALAAWEIFHQAGPSAHKQQSTYGILMMERRLAFYSTTANGP